MQINGLSNNYWGWGLEDDELYLRLKEGKIGIHRPGNFSTGTLHTFRYKKIIHVFDLLLNKSFFFLGTIMIER